MANLVDSLWQVWFFPQTVDHFLQRVVSASLLKILYVILLHFTNMMHKKLLNYRNMCNTICKTTTPSLILINLLIIGSPNRGCVRLLYKKMSKSLNSNFKNPSKLVFNFFFLFPFYHNTIFYLYEFFKNEILICYCTSHFEL